MASKDSASRLDFVDLLRGMAVVLMLLWHTTDSWLRADLRTGQTWDLLRLLGGMAAPTFVFLAGSSVMLKMRADARRGTALSTTWRGLMGRGLEVMVSGYTLRFLMWVIDARGYSTTGGLVVFVALVIAYSCLYAASKRFALAPRRAIPLALVGGVAFAIGLVQSLTVQSTLYIGLLRVDVLQAIGASIVVVSSVLAVTRASTRGIVVLVVLGFVITLVTEPIERLLPGPLPLPIAGYLGKIAVAPGMRAPSLFPLFPWTAYACFGAALASAWDRAAAQRRTLDYVVLFTALGALLALATKEMTPWNDELLVRAMWLIPLFRVFYRIGLMQLLAGLAAWAVHARPIGSSLRWLGQASLTIYWIHMELAFGVSATPLKRKLDLAQWAGWWTALTVAMTVVAWLRVRHLQRGWKRIAGIFAAKGRPKDALEPRDGI